MEPGDIYVYNNYGIYRKVKILNISRAMELDLSSDEYKEKTMVDYQYIGSYSNGLFDSTEFIYFISRSRSIGRDPKCWKCNLKLDEQEGDICSKCGWIICTNDYACGCNYPKNKLVGEIGI